jgi:hypothetical protein
MNLRGESLRFQSARDSNPTASSSSPLKWTKDIRFSRFKPTLAISRGIDSTAGSKRSL